MQKFSKIVFLSLAITLMFSLTGCGQKPLAVSPVDKTATENNLLNQSVGNDDPEKKFKNTAEVELPESPAGKTESEIRPVLEKIFNEVKVSSYGLQNTETGTIVVTYAIPRLPTVKDLPDISKAIKAKGFKQAFENNGEQASAIYEGGQFDAAVTYDTNQPVINVSYYPHTAPQY
jgi:predicted small lipoprotein YifL